MNSYIYAAADLAIIVTSLNLDGILNRGGIILGFIVGILTIIKLIQDIRINRKKGKE